MAYVIAQISDVHIGGHAAGSGARFSMAIEEVNAMTRLPDLVLLTGDLTDNGTSEEWDELRQRLAPLRVPWEAIAGNHDQQVVDLAGHRAIDAGPLRLVLVDSSSECFSEADAQWLDAELHGHRDQPTVIAIHHPPFETGIWWMDCVGLAGKELVEAVVRRHPQVIKVLSGHVHRPIQASWGACSLWVCPSTSVSIAADLDPHHHPAETAEGPSFSVHAYTGSGIVSHVVPVGPAATRTAIDSPEFLARVRDVQSTRTSAFG
jgi:3',5'-cyclic AMP phosphodiesterase CpdA